MTTQFIRRFLALAALGAVTRTSFSQVTVSIYSGFSASGDGAPFSGLVGTFLSNQIDFYGDLGGNWHPYGQTKFGAVVTGLLHVPTSGNYTFGLYHDDGASMTLDGNLFINGGGLGGGITGAPATHFDAGVYHSFSINFWEDGLGPSGLDLDMQTGINFNLVPASYLTVPEPSAFVCLGLGIVIVARRRVRRR